MFLCGRQKTTWLKGTAGLGVALMLGTLWRPALAATPVINSGPVKTPGLAQPGARPPEPVAARPASAPPERVRSAIVPRALRVEAAAAPGSDAKPASDPWALFDGDGGSAFETETPVKVRAKLPGSVALEAIGIYGDAAAVVTVSADETSGAKPVGGLERLSLVDRPLRWNRFEAAAPVEATDVIIEITPAPGTRTRVRELELWGKVAGGASAKPATAAAWAEALLTHLPAGAVEAAGSPAAAQISAPLQGPSGGFTFTVNLDRAGRSFERAFLVYELEGMAHWSSVIRRINWQAPQGGFHAEHVSRGALQVEEISPAWLRQGKNDFGLYVSNRNDPVGYKIKNLRVVGVPAAGDVAAQLSADTAPAGAPVRLLVDGSKDTALTSKDLRRAQVADFRFAGPSQPDSLLVAVEKGAKGSVTAEPIVKGKVDRRNHVSADLDGVAAGWARIPLGELATQADGIRVTIRGSGKETIGGVVSELRVTGSRVPSGRARELVVAYPLHGECVDGEAYVRGFLRSGEPGSVASAQFGVNGALRPGALARDGAFAATIAPPKEALASGGKWQVELEAIFADGDAVRRTVDIEGCREPVVAIETGPVEDKGAPFGQVVRAGQPAKLAFAGATLDIPAGAVDKDTRVTIRPISGVEVPATDETLTNVTPDGRAYRLGPHGLKFAKAVSLTIPYDNERFVGGQAEDDLGAYYFDDQAKQWRQIQTLKGDGRKRMLTAATDHFTDFITATISSPDHPSADSFNPTSIKDIKAADPAAEVSLIAPPSPNPDGSAHLSFPMWVPPGRQGLQPSLAATYSSDAGNSMLGVGWDLPISSIQVDTRFGAARYSTTAETETYTLDGELLVIDPNQTARGSRTSFHRRSEGTFDTILRLGPGGPTEQPHPDTGPTACHWEVIDKRGTRFIYGESYSARGSVLQRGVFRWYLERVVDAFGNQVLYKYDKRFPTLGDGSTTVPTVEIYPKQIDYTADATGANAAYRIKFEMDDGTDSPAQFDHFPRPDPFTNARGGSIAVTAHRLANIRVFQSDNADAPGDAVRRYNFVYKKGEFGKSLLSAIRVCIREDGTIGDVDDPAALAVEFYRHTFEYWTMGGAESGVLRTQDAAFEGPTVWGQVDSNQGLSATSSESLNGTLMFGGSVAGCDLFHLAAGGSTSLDIPIPLPDRFPHNNQGRTMGGLIDVNGDGLPDFVGKGTVFQSGGFIEGSERVFLNGGNVSLSPQNPRTFVSGSSSFLPPGSSFGHNSDFSVSLSVGGHALYEAAHASIERIWASSKDDTVLSDVNGDGFIDQLTPNGVALNRGAGFGQGMNATWSVQPLVSRMPASVLADQKARFRLVDPVILWTAPYSGHVQLGGAAQKSPNTHTGSDGITLMVQSFTTSGSPQSPIVSQTSSWQHTLNDPSSCEPRQLPATTGCRQFGEGNRTIFVKRGDRVYFRATAIDDIEDDRIAWNPTISYVDLSNDVGGNPQPVTGQQQSLIEPFGASAFAFNQAADFRLAGNPSPLWRSDSAGTGAVTIRIRGDIVKRPTSDAVTIQILKYPNGTRPPTAPTPVPLPASVPPMPLAHDFDGTIPLDFTTQVSPGDRLFFQVSSLTQIEPNRVTWSPVVEYVTFCRSDSIPASTTSTDPAVLAQALAQATTVCGAITGCTSALGSGSCQIQGDPDPVSNPISTSIAFQNMPAYYEPPLWTSIGPPVGFVAPSNGQITFTGALSAAPTGMRLVARRQQELLFDAQSPAPPIPGGTVAIPAAPGATIDVAAGDAILFDMYGGAQNPPANALWNVSLQFTGTAGTESHTIRARHNERRMGTDPGDGSFHSWTYLDWNGSRSLSNAVQFDQLVQQALRSQPNMNPQGDPPDVRALAQTPEGLAAGPNNNPPAVPGPLWRSGSIDGYIASGALKPSRLARPQIGGNSPAFSTTSNDVNSAGVGLIFGVQGADTTAATETQLIDMNGDQYPDLVTNEQVFLNNIANLGQPTETGTFEADPSRFDLDLGNNLRNQSGSNVTASLGIKSAVTIAKEGKPPTWASVLPMIGIGYGDLSTTSELMDINGDGLPDYVMRNSGTGRISVRFNLGTELADQAVTFGGEGFGRLTQAPTFNDDSALRTSPTGTFQNRAHDKVAAVAMALQKQDTAVNNLGAGYSYFGGGRTASTSRTTVDMLDINGDGLPDMVMRTHGSPTMSIWFNTGSGFASEVRWTMPGWPVDTGQALTVGFGSNDALAFIESVGFNLSAGYSKYYQFGIFGCYGVELGAGAGQGTTGSAMRFQDIDGDGAPDQVLKRASDGNVYVRRNPAGGQGQHPVNLLRRVMNGLGGGMELTYSRIGHVIDTAHHIDMPMHRFALNRITVHDGGVTFIGHGINVIETTIDYTRTDPPSQIAQPSGFHSRVDREFLGFSQLTIARSDGMQARRKYDNTTYERRHLLLEEAIRDTSGASPILFRKTVKNYQDRPVVVPNTTTVIPGVTFPALTSERTLFYEGLMTNNEAAPVKSTTLGHDYDAEGNPTVFDDLGDDDPNVTTDDIHYGIGYQRITDPVTGAIFPRPNDIIATGAGGNVLRHRVAVYGSRGEMRFVRDSIISGKQPETGLPYDPADTDHVIQTSFFYDQYGNVDLVFDGDGSAKEYTYDPVAHTYLATVEDNFGYTSSRTYDMRFGKLSTTTDVNGQRQRIDYDEFGRISHVFAPQDVDNQTATITFDYATTDGGVGGEPPFWARTRHKDAARPSDTLNTVVFVDGLGRVRQTKKDATVGGVEGRSVTGQVLFDGAGRVFQQGFPTFETPTTSPPNETVFNRFPLGRPSATYAYDVLDRQRAIQTPNELGTGNGPDGRRVVTTLIDYNNKVLDGRAQLVRTTQDPQGKLKTQYLSPRSEMLAVSEVNRVGSDFPTGTPTVLTTKYWHDPLSRVVQVQDPAGNLTTASYDGVGHIVKLTSPDTGQTEWRYDQLGRLREKETPRLRAAGKLIKYAYEANRLTKVDYPEQNEIPFPATRDVTYTYGAVGAPHNQVGRIATIDDESGTETLRYDQLGNVSRMEKALATQLPSIPRVTYKMDYVYDPFGRVLNMTYPDGEKVEYGYDSGGRVNRVAGTRRNGTQTTYVASVAYNELEQRERLSLGNGVTTGYVYYPDTKRLRQLNTDRPASGGTTIPMQRLAYTYDLIGNITLLSNDIDVPTPVPPNTVVAPGPTQQGFVYDDLYQLVNASGNYRGCACGCANARLYTLTMQYDKLGNILRKNQTDNIQIPAGSSNVTQQAATTYNNAYAYTGPRPHAPTAIGGATLSYDADGNMTATNGNFGPSRTLTWTEDDRLRTEADSGFTSTFLYDADGNRSHKRRTTLETWYVNALYQVKNSLTQTKHIMMGDDRIVSAVATITNRADPTTAGTQTLFYYHPDHLQSTGFVTGADASILQHDEYFPSGEVWFQEAKNNDARNTQSWLFSAKELDETGLYYFGARYYNPKFSVWTSPDPILAGYMRGAPSGGVFEPRNLGLYTYSWNNSVVLRDIDGRATEPAVRWMNSLGELCLNEYCSAGGGMYKSSAWSTPGEVMGQPTFKPKLGFAYLAAVGGQIGAVALSPGGLLALRALAMKEAVELAGACAETGDGATCSKGFLAVAAMSFPEGPTGPGLASGAGGVVRATGRLSQFLRNKLGHIRNEIAAGGFRGIKGAVTEGEAFALGEAFVGPGYTVSKSGKSLNSADGLRQYRLPSSKHGIDPVTNQPFSRTGTQVNFESRTTPSGTYTNNVHLDVKP